MNEKPNSKTTIMSGQRSTYVTREKVIGMLTEEELASVSNAESASGLVEGDDYLDLENLKRGVLQAGKSPIVMGHVLPRKSINNTKWDEIVAFLSHPRAA